jgi:hypothetical protein
MQNQTISFGPVPFPSFVLEDSSPNIPHPYRSDGPGRYLDLAVNTLAEYDIAIPDHQFLEVIVSSAVAAQYLFFTAALHEPTENELDQFIEAFVLRCASTTRVT